MRVVHADRVEEVGGIECSGRLLRGRLLRAVRRVESLHLSGALDLRLDQSRYLRNHLLDVSLKFPMLIAVASSILPLKLKRVRHGVELKGKIQEIGRELRGANVVDEKCAPFGELLFRA